MFQTRYIILTMYKYSVFLLLAIAFFTTSCVKDKIIPAPEPIIKTYLHIAHTRTENNYEVDETVSKIDYSKFDLIWLGGDMEQLTSVDDSAMAVVDAVFDLKNKNTLWSIGNHDYTDIQRVSKFTKRKSYYSYYKNGITFIVLDTQLDKCSISGEQQMMFDEVTDTLNNSSYLIILQHKLVWMYNNDSLEKLMETVPNAPLGNHSYSIYPNNFYTAVYPKLLKIKQKGIEVLCIAGDIGIKTSKFEYISPEGIFFLASGIHSGHDGNKALLFTHDITNQKLSWKYILVSDLEEKSQILF